MVKKTIMSFITIISLIASVPIYANDTHTDIENTTYNSENVIVSEVMSFDELANQMAKDMNISIQESINILLSHSNDDRAMMVASTYRTFTKRLQVVRGVYEPTINFYCETSEGGGHMGILSVLNTNLNRIYTDSSNLTVTKQFAGTIFVNLEDANTIYYTIDGDFYNIGKTTVSGGGSIGVGEYANLSFSVSYESEHYKTYYVADRVKFGG